LGRLRYLEAPPRLSSSAGRPRGSLILIHAFPLNARMWEPQLALADGGWRVIAPQLRGMDDGASDPPATSIDDYAADVIDLLDTLHIEDAVIGGLSMGGYVSFALFRHAPRYFRGMVLADTRSQADTLEGVEARKRMVALVRERGPAAIAAEMVPKLLSEPTRQHHPDVVERVRALTLANSAEAIAGALTTLMTRPDSTPLLQTIHCPTLILVGNHDTVTPPALSDELHQKIAGSELAIIEDAGHLSSIEQPAAFNTALARFLEHRV
jgi:pimeloyl-ACP methyl ester carboxylesterase